MDDSLSHLRAASVPRRPVLDAALLGLAAGLGVAFGIASLWGQGRAHGEWNMLANSGAVWTVIALATAVLCGRSRPTAVTAGTLALVGEVVGYYRVAAPWRGIPTTRTEELLWAGAALVVGPLAGLAAHYVRRGSATQRVVSLLGVCGVIVGEGVYGLARFSGHPASVKVEIVVGLVGALAALASSKAPWRARAAAIPVAVVVAAAVFLFYSDPVVI